MSHPAFDTNRSVSLHFGRYSFPVPQRVGGWVGLGGWLHTEVVCSLEDGHPPQYQPTDSAAGLGIKLTTNESQVDALTSTLSSHLCNMLIIMFYW